MSRHVPLTSSICTYVESVLITRCLAMVYTRNCPYKQLLWMRLKMEEIVRGQRVEQFLECDGIRFMQKELLPEAFGLFYFFFFLA